MMPNQATAQIYKTVDKDGNVVLHKGSKGVYTKADFESEWPGVKDACDWVTMLAMTGTHNAVPGIKGIGPKTALKAMTGDNALLAKIMQEHGDIVRRNERLIELPHPDLVDDPPEIKFSTGTMNPRELIRFLARYGITVQGFMREPLEYLEY